MQVRAIVIVTIIVLATSWSKTLAKGNNASDINKYNITWNSPSEDKTGQMPLGNGDIAAGVYAIENDSLYLLLAKNDALTYNGDIFKTGRVRVDITPNPFTSGKPFTQTMNMKTGSVEIEADGVTLLIWADANKPIYHIQVNSKADIEISAMPELWERIDGTKHNRTSAPIAPPTQDVKLERNGNIIWYYSVGDRSVYPEELKFYDVEYMADKYPDPFKFNTFGNLLACDELSLENGKLRGKGKRFDIRIHSLTEKAKDVEDWICNIEKLSKTPINTRSDWKKHCKWWADFWDRSSIVINDNSIPAEDRGKISNEGYSKTREAKDKGALVAQSYNVFRYLMACQSRGNIQAKFNGGLFTQPLRYSSEQKIACKQVSDKLWISHEDERLWGRRFTFQNQRLLYWPSFMSGDYDIARPFVMHYWKLLPIRTAITKAWFGHEGTYFRENTELTGGERDCGKGQETTEDKPLKTAPGKNDGNGYYHSYYFTCGLETVTMMIEYAKYTGNSEFRDTVLVPFAREILTFFDKHYERDEAGMLKIDPAMVLETFWVAVNPAPDIAGLRYNLQELINMGIGTDEDKTNWNRFLEEIPEVHLHEIEGKTCIAPALEYSVKRNSENGELYPVFPFRLFGLGNGNADIVNNTMKFRTLKDAFGLKCWTQDQIDWAYAGNAKEARDGLIKRYSHSSDQCRFPVYGSERPDSCPDFDHFGSGSTALQRMLLQETDDKILLLPAWPANWDVDFKLHLSYGTIVSGVVKDGKLTKWNISPKNRKKDVIIYKPQI